MGFISRRRCISCCGSGVEESRDIALRVDDGKKSKRYRQRDRKNKKKDVATDKLRESPILLNIVKAPYSKSVVKVLILSNTRLLSEERSPHPGSRPTKGVRIVGRIRQKTVFPRMVDWYMFTASYLLPGRAGV